MELMGLIVQERDRSADPRNTAPSTTLAALESAVCLSQTAGVALEVDLSRSSTYDLVVNHLDRITIEDGKRGGKPCIRGLRITVYDVLDYLASGMTSEEILNDFPDLERDDILACLEFAADRERKMVSVPVD